MCVVFGLDPKNDLSPEHTLDQKIYIPQLWSNEMLILYLSLNKDCSLKLWTICHCFASFCLKRKFEKLRLVSLRTSEMNITWLKYKIYFCDIIRVRWVHTFKRMVPSHSGPNRKYMDRLHDRICQLVTMLQYQEL